MLTTSETPLYIQRSFVEKIVNARWDPHSPPDSNYRAAYIYQSSSQINHTVFGWLYYDGQDEFGRSGVPYFIAHYLLGELDKDQLQIILNCLEKGPIECVERHIGGDKTLGSLILNEAHSYDPARPGVTIPSKIWTNSLAVLNQKQSIDWFMPQPRTHQPQDHEISANQTVKQQFQPRLHETPLVSSGDLTVNTIKIEAILQDLVDQTMGIQGAALVSEEGHPIVSVIGLNDNTSGIVAGTILYMARETNRELNWQSFETITLRGPDSYVMLSACLEGIYLLIKSDKVPMGLVEGSVNRSISKLKTELNSPVRDAPVTARPALMPLSPPATTTDIETITIPQSQIEDSFEDSQDEFILEAPPKKIVSEEEPDLTYRGRPIN